MSDTLDVVLDVSLRIQVDDVSDGQGREFRASIYDSKDDYELVADGWGATKATAITSAILGMTDKDWESFNE